MVNPLIESPQSKLILVTGATGYVGGRLLKPLEQSGYKIRCLARHPAFLKNKVRPDTQIVAGDVFNTASLKVALTGVDTAYYLVHSMGSTGSFVEEDRQGALNFGTVARECGVRKIIYLGGLGESKDILSSHLRSRQEVGEILQQSGVPVIEFRASIVIGSGSLSFEMIRALVERLPVMITPRWVSTPAQPIAIEDLIQYLIQALELSDQENHIFEIGGKDQVSYGDIMREYARQRGLPRVMIKVPILTPRLSSLWLGLVTPLYSRVGRKLIDSLRHPTIVKDDTALKIFNMKPRGIEESIRRALLNEDREIALTRWSDALSSSAKIKDWGGVQFGSRIIDSRTIKVNKSTHAAFQPIERIGGNTGWYYGNWLWQIRGFMDLLVGGVGMRRGRRDPEKLLTGDTVDFWRVEEIQADKFLRLSSEMKLPGRAWLEFEVTGGNTSSIIRQTAIFDPLGLTGLLYWYLLYPMHTLIFQNMLRKIAMSKE